MSLVLKTVAANNLKYDFRMSGQCLTIVSLSAKSSCAAA